MAFQPNYYQSYPRYTQNLNQGYNNGYNQFGYLNQGNAQFGYQNQGIQNQQQTMPTIYGKVVDSIDVVKAMDQPLGQSGVYPKADSSAIYVKLWTNDGTTQVIEYTPTVVEDVKQDNTLDGIYQALDDINKKIDGLKNVSPNGVRRKKEGGQDEQ